MTASYPSTIRPCLRASKARSQPAVFKLAEPKRGRGYVQPVGTDVPVFWDVEFLFTQEEAIVFWLWFKNTLGAGVNEFIMPIRTEFGMVSHTCQFMPDSLMNSSEDGGLRRYKATIMARSLITPASYDDASDLITTLPAWRNWAAALDQAVSLEMTGA